MELKDNYFSDLLKGKVLHVFDFTELSEKQQEVKLSFQVTTDDGGLLAALSTVAMDLIRQLELGGIKLKNQEMWQSTYMMAEG